MPCDPLCWVSGGSGSPAFGLGSAKQNPGSPGRLSFTASTKVAAPKNKVWGGERVPGAASIPGHGQRARAGNHHHPSPQVKQLTPEVCRPRPAALAPLARSPGTAPRRR